MIQEESGGDPARMEAAMDGVAHLARDHARTPMQWDDSANRGLSTGVPWMRTHDNYEEINVKKQLGEAGSPLQFWKRLLQFRKEHRHL